MRRSAILAVLALAATLSLAAACSAPGPTEVRRTTTTRHDGDPVDTIKKCGGMIGSGTATC
jgi:hypothetical protein